MKKRKKARHYKIQLKSKKTFKQNSAGGAGREGERERKQILKILISSGSQMIKASS